MHKSKWLSVRGEQEDSYAANTPTISWNKANNINAFS